MYTRGKSMATLFLYVERGVQIIPIVNLEVMTVTATCIVVIVCPVLSFIPFSSHRDFTHKHKAIEQRFYNQLDAQIFFIQQ
jgi:hypothetical protein